MNAMNVARLIAAINMADLPDIAARRLTRGLNAVYGDAIHPFQFQWTDQRASLADCSPNDCKEIECDQKRIEYEGE